MSRNLLASMLVAALLGSSAFAATGSVAKKGKDEKFAPRRPVAAAPVDGDSLSTDLFPENPGPSRKADPISRDASIDGFAPAVTLPSGPAIDAGGIDVKGVDPTVDPADVPSGGSGAATGFTGSMLDLYLQWLGVDLGTAIRYGLLEDARLFAMFLDALAHLRAQAGRK